MIIGNAIRGSGDTKWMLYTQLLGTVGVVSIAAFLVFGCKMGITGVFLAVIFDEIIRAVINLTRYLHIVRKWGDD